MHGRNLFGFAWIVNGHVTMLILVLFGFAWIVNDSFNVISLFGFAWIAMLM